MALCRGEVRGQVRGRRWLRAVAAAEPAGRSTRRRGGGSVWTTRGHVRSGAVSGRVVERRHLQIAVLQRQVCGHGQVRGAPLDLGALYCPPRCLSTLRSTREITCLPPTERHHTDRRVAWCPWPRTCPHLLAPHVHAPGGAGHGHGGRRCGSTHRTPSNEDGGQTLHSPPRRWLGGRAHRRAPAPADLQLKSPVLRPALRGQVRGHGPVRGAPLDPGSVPSKPTSVSLDAPSTGKDAALRPLTERHHTARRAAPGDASRTCPSPPGPWTRKCCWSSG